MADTGWLTASEARNVDVSPGIAWSSVANCKVSDNNDASVVMGGNGYSAQLNPYTFGANIPSENTVLGIELRVERASAVVDRLKDKDIYLMDDTSTKGNNKADTGIFWPNTDTWKTYGSSSDLWGASWTPAQINASTFGASVRCENNAGNAVQGYIDCMQIKIYYSIPSNVNHLMMMGM